YPASARRLSPARSTHANPLSEEPDAGNPHVRICGSPGQATTGATRPDSKSPRFVGKRCTKWGSTSYRHSRGHEFNSPHLHSRKHFRGGGFCWSADAAYLIKKRETLRKVVRKVPRFD